MVDNQVVELQSWKGTTKVRTQPGPKGRFLNVGTSDYRLILYTRRGVLEWNVESGVTAEIKYSEKKYSPPKELFVTVAGEPQFRGKKKWCVVLIDGDVKAEAPLKIYHKTLKQWRALPVSERSALVSGPLLKRLAPFLLRGLLLCLVATGVVGISYALCWFFLIFLM